MKNFKFVEYILLLSLVILSWELIQDVESIYATLIFLLSLAGLVVKTMILEERSWISPQTKEITMTNTQEERYRKLQKRLSEVYNDYEKNHDKKKDKFLFERWQKVIKRYENFLDKVF